MSGRESKPVELILVGQEGEHVLPMPADFFNAVLAGNADIPFDRLAVSTYLLEAAFKRPEGSGWDGVVRRFGKQYAFSLEQRKRFFNRAMAAVHRKFGVGVTVPGDAEHHAKAIEKRLGHVVPVRELSSEHMTNFGTVPELGGRLLAALVRALPSSLDSRAYSILRAFSAHASKLIAKDSGFVVKKKAYQAGLAEAARQGLLENNGDHRRLWEFRDLQQALGEKLAEKMMTDPSLAFLDDEPGGEKIRADIVRQLLGVYLYSEY